MDTKKQTTLLLILLIIPPVVIFLSRQLFAANYIFSSIYKIIFLFPLFFRLFIEKKTLKHALFENFSFKRFRKNIFSIMLIGVILASIYVSSFLLFKDRLDLQIIATKLHELVSLNISNLIFIGLYIVIVNSLLEEYFWRGFVFEKLRKLIKPWMAYIFTGIAFSFHHIIFYYNWFNMTFFLIVTIGLIFYAIIMNFIFQRYKDLLSCWLVHSLVDIAQIFIAFKIFGLI
jgi:membrane protease YdiL (CAAX protease family)